jgi:hypothetical protein
MAYVPGEISGHNIVARGDLTIGEIGSPIKMFRMGQCKLNAGEVRVDTPGVSNQTKIFVVYNILLGMPGLAFDISRAEGEYVLIRSLKSIGGAIQTADESVIDWIAFEPG